MNISLQGGASAFFLDSQIPTGPHDPLLIDYFLPCLFNGTHALHLLSLAVLYPMINFLISLYYYQHTRTTPGFSACRGIHSLLSHLFFFSIFFLYTLDFLPLLFPPSGRFCWAGTRRMAGWVVVHFF